MRVEVRMARLGYDMTSGKIIEWLKAEGEFVERGEALLEVETDKVTVAMESLESGVLVEIRHRPGEAVLVGEVIAILEQG